MTEAASTEVGTRLLRCGAVEIFRGLQIQISFRPGTKVGENLLPRKLFLLADKIPRYPAESTFGSRTELVIAMRFLAHHKFPAARAGIKPHGVWRFAPVRAIETNPRPQFHEWSSLWQLHGLFVLDANPSRSCPAFLRTDRAHQNLVTVWRGARQPPFSRRSSNYSNERHERENCDNKENFVRRSREAHKHAADTFVENMVPVNIRGCV